VGSHVGELDNCIRCGKLFVKTTRDICQDCYKEEEKQFQIVYQFMKKRSNRQATVSEIVDETAVAEELIIKFVKEKRLRASQFPNIAFPCEKCGADIQQGRLCSSCSAAISADLEHESQLDQVKQRNIKAEQDKSNRTYFAVEKGKRNN
jgi:flagellar operon protein (TIGR03826 family)